MENTKRKKKTNLNYPKLQHEKKTTILSGYLSEEPSRGYLEALGERGLGGQTDSACQKAPHARRQHGRGNAALAAFPWPYQGAEIRHAAP